jgi:hypothetical protein
MAEYFRHANANHGGHFITVATATTINFSVFIPIFFSMIFLPPSLRKQIKLPLLFLRSFNHPLS